MKNLAILSIVLANTLFATSISELVENSLSSSFDLKALETKVQIADQQIAISKNWQNPILVLKSNEIMLNKHKLNNNKEYGVEFIQEIPIGNKLEIEKQIAIKDRNIQSFDLEDKKLELKSKLNLFAYTILIYEKRENLLDEYLQNLEKLYNLNKELLKIDKSDLNTILNTKINTQKIKTEQEILKTKIDNLYLNLEQITYEKYTKIDDSLAFKNIDETKLLEDLSSHPKIKSNEEEILKYKDYSKLEEAKKFSNVVLGLEYMQNNIQDYANISLGFTLPIYKTENINKIKAKLNANETQNKKEIIKKSFEIETKIILNNIKQNITSFNRYQNEIIPLKQSIQNIINQNIKLDISKLEDSINNLNELIDLELKSLEYLEEYFTNYSRLIYYSNQSIESTKGIK